MDWQEIMEQTLEINELQQEVLVKSQNKIIKEITDRRKKYLTQEKLELSSLNNAILEHQIILTPYQITILTKINDLELNSDPQSIYINMPTTEIEAEKYVTELKAKYQLAINCLDLVMNIERLSQIEYQLDYPFENTIYAKKRKIENEIFLTYLLGNADNADINQDVLEMIITNKRKEFIKSLSVDEKKQLLLETLALSYDRNAFEYFDEENVIMKSYTQTKGNINMIRIAYNIYKSLLIDLENRNLLKMPLTSIYDEWKLIYDTELLNQKKK